VGRKAALRQQIHVELDALLPGLAAATGDIFDHEPALLIARRLGSAAAIREAGLAGLVALLRAERIGFHRRSLVKVLACAEQAAEPSDCAEVHRRIFSSLDDERRARPR